MSALAVLFFSEASIAVRRRVRRQVVEFLFAEVPADVPVGRPALLRDAGIACDTGDPARPERLMLDRVYRSHWML